MIRILRVPHNTGSPRNPHGNAAFFWLLCGFFFFFPAAPKTAAGQDFLPDGETVLRAYQYCYPDRAGDAALRNGDWSITVGGKIFFWAGGRLLPEGEERNWRQWRPQDFSLYPAGIPAPEDFSAEEIAAMREEAYLEAGNREHHHRAFQAALYGGSYREEIEQNLRRTVFLGRSITVHYLIVENLRRVDAAIRAAAENSRETAAFLAGLRSAGGYNFREIRGTGRLSYHAWGLAVDLLGAAERDLAVYWLWERERNPDWMLVPLARRWKPPDAVIRAFENEGFVWGGKWNFYDTMHFEFRPEIHEIRRLVRAGEGSRLLDLHHLFPER